jgi:hypothetical protein
MMKDVYDNIIQLEDGSWVFIDETGTHSGIKYRSRYAAERGLQEYCKWLNGKPYDVKTIYGTYEEEEEYDY